MRLRLSIRALMAVVVLAAVVIAAWRSATALSANVVFNLTVLTLLIASFKARYTRGAAGAWWFGFALCGSVYLIRARSRAEGDSSSDTNTA